MFPALFRRELAGQLAGFGGQSAAGGFLRVVEFLLSGALRLITRLISHFREALSMHGIVFAT